MRKISRFCSALLLVLLLQPGLDASPIKAALQSETPSLEIEDAESKALHSFSHPHPHTPYEVNIHDYNHNALQNKPPETSVASLHHLTDSVVGFFKYVDKFFHFIKFTHKDNVLATDVVDDSWEEWLKSLHQIVPVISKYKVSASDIENPHEDAQETLSLRDKLLYKFLRGSWITKVKKKEKEDEEEEVEDEVSEIKYTSIKFDPLGNFFDGAFNTLRFYTGYDSIREWFKSIRDEFKNYSAFTEEILSEDELESGVADAVADGGGLLSVPLPPGILRLAKYEPWYLGINAAFFLFFHAFLWGFYIPGSSYGSFFGDDPVRTTDNDYLNDEEDYDDYDGENFGNDEEQGEGLPTNGDEPQGGGPPNGSDTPGEGPPNDGFPDEGNSFGNEDTRRLDSYAYYSHYYNRYNPNGHILNQPDEYTRQSYYPRHVYNQQYRRVLR